ncbi:MAG: regulatory protein RecX [Gammaproteobacteria bacterium]|nr:regulatory protein RecX [Gammaproteobacteria bacterium]
MALGLLARREHSRRELTEKLQARAFEIEPIREALDRLEEQGWLDEGRFIESFVRSRVQKAYGPLRIKAELAQRGIDRSRAERALRALQDEWPAIAEQALRHRFGTPVPATLDDHRRFRNFLLRRGFVAEQVTRLVRRPPAP